MRILGIDYGASRVGLALGDTETKIATPWSVVPNEGARALLSRIHDVVTREEVSKIVVGVPRSLRERKNASQQAQDIEAFVEELKQLGVPVNTEDEVMSSALAARQAQEMGEKGKRDDLAAAVILQSWLDRQ